MTNLRSMLSTLADIMAGQSPLPLTGLRFKPPAGAPSPGTAYPALDAALTRPEVRWCCSLNAQSGTVVEITDVAGHQYYAAGFMPSSDAVGYIYTKHGGIVDIGHVRDLADTTRFLASKAYFGLKNGTSFEMAEDFGGTPKITFKATGADPSPALAALLGARIAYELAIWHEAGTWFSMQPFQKPSSFSPEDNYSNCLGTYIGFLATLTNATNYNQAVDSVLVDTLNAMGALLESMTQLAIGYVKGFWFDTGSTYRRHLQALPQVTPWLLTEVPIAGKHIQLQSLQAECGGKPPSVAIHIPERFADGTQLNLLSNYYDLEIDIGLMNLSLNSFLSAPPDLIATPIKAASLPALIKKLKPLITAEYPSGDLPF